MAGAIAEIFGIQIGKPAVRDAHAGDKACRLRYHDIEHVAQTVMTGHNRYRDMSNKRNPNTDPNQPMIYQIRIKGHLGRQWTDWFGGLSITPEENGETLLRGPVVDQAALYGLLRKVRDLGMPLLAVIRLQPDLADAPDVQR